MTDTPARLLRLLALLQQPREWPGSELAERLEVSARTIRRDIDRLRSLGYPVQATHGSFGGYQMSAGAAMPPLLLDDDEAIAIAVGLRTSARQPVAGIEEASLRALSKLQQVLPARLRHRVSALSSATVQTPAFDQPTVNPELLSALSGAIAKAERVRFSYRSSNATVSRRLVEPHRLVVAGRRWYLVAYDNEQHGWRTFRLDRVTELKLTGTRVPPRELPATDSVTFVTDTLYDLVPTYRATATVHAPADEVRPVLGEGYGDLTVLTRQSCRWHSQADTLDWLAFRLILTGYDFTVHEPAELVSHLRTVSRRVQRSVRSSR